VFWYLPSKVQNLATVILSALASWRVITMLEEDFTLLLNGDSRSLFILADDDSTWYGVWRYFFQVLVLCACALALRKNFAKSNDTVV